MSAHPQNRARKVKVSRNTEFVLDHCTAADLRRAATVARRERDREARRVQAAGRPGSGGRARKISSAIAHAVDAEFFEALAQRLEARQQGRRALLAGVSEDAGEPMRVASLGDALIFECAAAAVAKVQVNAPA